MGFSTIGHTRQMTDFGEWVHLDPHAGPLFDQLRLQIIEAIRSGRLPAGTRLPTVRDLAGTLGTAANTVARAYREMETAGVLETRGGQGLSWLRPTRLPPPWWMRPTHSPTPPGPSVC